MQREVTATVALELARELCTELMKGDRDWNRACELEARLEELEHEHDLELLTWEVD